MAQQIRQTRAEARGQLGAGSFDGLWSQIAMRRMQAADTVKRRAQLSPAHLGVKSLDRKLEEMGKQQEAISEKVGVVVVVDLHSIYGSQ